MVLVAAASDHRHRRAAKSSRQDTNPVAPSPSKFAAGKASDAGAAFQGFSFSWGAHRRLRCSKDGAPAYASPSPPVQHPHTPSPDKDEKPEPPSRDTPAGVVSSRPQRPRNLRPLRYAAAASRPDGALQSPPSARAPKPTKRGFAVALTKEQIARDFAASRRCCRCPSATRPVPPPARRRGKTKRPKPVQDAIDMVCPGLVLQDVDLDNYKIEEKGLKKR